VRPMQNGCGTRSNGERGHVPEAQEQTQEAPEPSALTGLLT